MIEHPVEIALSEADHAIPALPFKRLAVHPLVHLERRCALQFLCQVADAHERLNAQRQMDVRIRPADAVQVGALDSATLFLQGRVGERFKLAAEQRQIALGVPVEMQVDLVLDVAAHERLPHPSPAEAG